MKDILPDIIFKTPSVIELKSSLYKDKHIRVSMLRLDEIHPIISGNKLFKLYYFLDEARNSSHKKIITFGGAFSNHLAATAFACKEMNIKSVGIVRGEKPFRLSHTLLFCLDQGMELQFISRGDYKKINEKEFLEGLKKQLGECILIPEGGFSIKGKEGASLITQTFDSSGFTHICVAVGTATTFAGIIEGSSNQCDVTGFSVLKNMHDINKRLHSLEVNSSKKYSFVADYHFGGYAKKTDELMSFMNSFYIENNIPLDFVYTAKMMFGVNDLVQKNYFPPGSNILCIHTGGLQGNQSLPEGTLIF
jgi:1-aminocyclopropane-1-carboxylate deaminase/D-cysteine desulfhydrase-like pyridoxal-dependent ACC family enzyme